MLSAGTTVAEKYRLERPLASGGMGAVWVATHLQLDVRVAVKFMDSALAASPEARRRFEHEAKAAAQLKSQHIIVVLDHGVGDGTPYLVMELLDGEDLASRLKREKRLRVDVAAGIGVQIAKALHRAHEAGIVHRDIKPSNVFLARLDDMEVVKVLDFGLAKVTGGKDRDATRTGAVMGSVNYMSPEQARSPKSVDHRTDLWSLGVVLFRAVTGQLPFLGETDADTIVRICTERAAPPSSLVPGLAPEVDAFFARALVADPNGRFGSANEMAAALAALARLGGAPEVPSSFFVAGPRAAVPEPSIELSGRDFLHEPTAPFGAGSGPPLVASTLSGGPRFGAPPVEPTLQLAPAPMAPFRSVVADVAPGSISALGEIPPAPRPKPGGGSRAILAAGAVVGAIAAVAAGALLFVGYHGSSAGKEAEAVAIAVSAGVPTTPESPTSVASAEAATAPAVSAPESPAPSASSTAPAGSISAGPPAATRPPTKTAGTPAGSGSQSNGHGLPTKPQAAPTRAPDPSRLVPTR